MNKLNHLLNRAQKTIGHNSPVILTAIGVTGAVTTAVLASKASFKASDVLREEQARLDSFEKSHPMTNKEKFEKVWTLYIPAVVSGAFTCTAIIFANRIGTRRTAAMATALTISDRAYAEYKEKVIETVGKNKEQKVRDEIAQDRVNSNPVSKQQVIITGGGDVLCYDKYTGRYFMSGVETLKKAQNDLNYQLMNEGYASLNEFYNKIGLSHVPTGEEVGWCVDKGLLELQFSTTMSDDERPCIAVDFFVGPMVGFFRTH